MLFESLNKFLFKEQPFLGGIHLGLLGPIRHVPMMATVDLFSDRRDPIRILEIGSWLGSSALTWSIAVLRLASHHGSVMCVDHWEPYLPDSEYDRSPIYETCNRMHEIGLSYDIFRHNISFAPKNVAIDHIRGKSTRILPYMREKYFDIIYLDGSHYYQDVMDDLSLCVPLLRDGGIICGDDLEAQCDEVDQDLMNANLAHDTLIDPKSGSLYHPGVTKAVGEVFGEVASYFGFWLVRLENGEFSVPNLSGRRYFVPPHFSQDAIDLVRKFMTNNDTFSSLVEAK